MLTPSTKAGLEELPIIWVKTTDELYNLIEIIDGIDAVALDTEFIKRNTYFPILALVQINTGTAIYLVDAPRLDLTEFWQALAEIPEMIWYACGEDLGIFYLLSGCSVLTNVIDVQLAVAYLTGELQMGYARAIDEYLGVSLDKTESKSDWLMRPLSHEQEQYAADDVRYLLALWNHLKQLLQAKNLTTFVLEDSRLYAYELHETFHKPDEALYLDYIAPVYTHRQIAVLQALVAWREKLARSTNQPRTFILSKQSLRDIVLNLPTSMKQLSSTTIRRDALRLYGNEIIHIVKTILALPVHELVPMPRPSYINKQKPFNKALQESMRQYSKQSCIPENLLLKSRWLDELLYIAAVDEELGNRAFLGYRHDWITKAVLPILKEHKVFIRQVMGI